MRVVAEWVETAAQCHQLRELQCDSGQGWHFAPPVGADAVPDPVLSPPWLDGWIPDGTPTGRSRLRGS